MLVFQAKTMGKKLGRLKDELKNIRTIELAYQKNLFLERIFWAVLGILGVAWAFYFVPSNLEVWKNNPSIVSKGNMDLSEINYPAITIAPSGITKFAIAERLANYLKPEKTPDELKQIKSLLFKCAVLSKHDPSHDTDFRYYKSVKFNCRYKSDECEVICQFNHNHLGKIDMSHFINILQ